MHVEADHRFAIRVERGFTFITDTSNWSKFWPGYVRLEEGSSWGAAGDTARLVRAIRQAFRRTFAALEREFASS
jgi:hypothetical protein